MPHIKEDLQGFLDKTSGKGYRGDAYDPLFKNNPAGKLKARHAKRSWSEEADIAFFQSLTKIHWFQIEPAQRLRKILSASGKDEISTSAYRSGKQLHNDWGFVGIELQGRPTLAANDMDHVYSGYSEDIKPEDVEKHKSSGLPRRATMFINAKGYSLDAESFKDGSRSEIILDNWKPVALILTDRALKSLKVATDEKLSKWELQFTCRFAKNIADCVALFCEKTNLPIKDEKGNIQSRDAMMNLAHETHVLCDKVVNESLIKKRGRYMSNLNLKQFIAEVLDSPQMGQKFKTTTRFPITTSSGKDVEVQNVKEVDGKTYVLLSITDGEKRYNVWKEWEGVSAPGKEWLEK
jgi:hypothetical protein